MVRVREQKLDPGCYADGSFGYDHIRAVLADMVEGFLNDSELSTSLRGPMPDDDGDTLDAIDKLNGITDGGYWTVDQGDLFLVEHDSELDKALQLGA